MSIEKITLAHEQQPFTTMFNTVLQGIGHTGALGVYCYLASKPPGWNIVKLELQRHFNCGREHMTTCINILKGLGLIEIIQNKDEKGRFISTQWLLKCTICITDSTRRETRPPVNAADGNSATINKRSLKIKERPLDIKDSSIEKPSADALADDDPIKILKKYEIKPPKNLTAVHKRYIKKAHELLLQSNLSLDDYLNYLTNRCSRALLPYITNGMERQNGFGNIFRPTFINNVLNGKWKD